MAQAMSSELLTLEETQQRKIREQLACIVESQFFRSSQRCCRFLEYSVQHALAGRSHEDVKERTIGIEVFHRPATYDTGQDNIVRVTANEVRKRLAQYYGKSGSDHDVVVTLPQGSYLVAFEWRSACAKELAPSASVPPKSDQIEAISQSRFQPLKIITIAVVVVVAVLLAAVLYERFRRQDVVQKVWSTLLESDKPVLVCIAQPVAYLPPSAATTGATSDQFVALPDAFVGVGDAYALADITELLSARGKRWKLLAGNETPSQELKSGPVVLIGAFSNPWTLRLTEDLRYTYDLDPKNVIRDRLQPARQWRLENLSPDW